MLGGKIIEIQKPPINNAVEFCALLNEALEKYRRLELKKKMSIQDLIKIEDPEKYIFEQLYWKKLALDYQGIHVDLAIQTRATIVMRKFIELLREVQRTIKQPGLKFNNLDNYHEINGIIKMKEQAKYS